MRFARRYCLLTFNKILSAFVRLEVTCLTQFFLDMVLDLSAVALDALVILRPASLKIAGNLFVQRHLSVQPRITGSTRRNLQNLSIALDEGCPTVDLIVGSCDLLRAGAIRSDMDRFMVGSADANGDRRRGDPIPSGVQLSNPSRHRTNGTS